MARADEVFPCVYRDRALWRSFRVMCCFGRIRNVFRDGTDRITLSFPRLRILVARNIAQCIYFRRTRCRPRVSDIPENSMFALTWSRCHMCRGGRYFMSECSVQGGSLESRQNSGGWRQGRTHYLLYSIRRESSAGSSSGSLAFLRLGRAS